ncbi:MAG: hypothetical protein EPN97_11190 [Alphaproteobacteria bacterium]|nr:MAG: hypothetical protein EPN97_11190 [Alphaproteobacteria bacterium]
MTEEAPYIRPRPVRKKIIQLILAVVALQSLYLMFQHASSPLKEWPADLTDRAAYCRLETYKSCHAGDWFGLLKSRGNTGVLKEICTDWKDRPDSAKARMIDAADGDMLYLCRMKDPAHIDGSRLPK